jgi:uncharacterized RDD family membrane protein YckC
VDGRQHEGRLEDGVPALNAPEIIAPPAEGERAGFVTRFAAFFADATVCTIGLRVTDWLLRALPKVLGRFAPPVSLDAVFAALVPALVAAYFVVFWTVLGQTPGKVLMGIKIVPIGGGRMTLGRSLARLFGCLLSSLPLYLGFLWMLGPRRRGWHDLLAQTEVVYVHHHPVSTAGPGADVRARMLASIRHPVSYYPPAPVPRLGPPADWRP